MRDLILQKMVQKGLKLTPQRVAIIDFLVKKKPLHPGARLVYKELKNKLKSLSLSTVYLTLNELEKHGLIKILEFDKMENRCELNMGTHINLICDGCHKIMDYPSLPLHPDDVLEKSHFLVTDTRLECYGLCEQCQERRSFRKAVHGKRLK